MTTPLSRTLLAATALPLLLLVCNTGCGNAPADLRLTSLDNHATFTQQFSQAYVSTDNDGDTQIVLVKDDSRMRQIMLVKVLWRPPQGAKQAHPSYTNAALNWYVFCEKGAGTMTSTPDALEYTGAGFVSLSDTPLGTQVNIRNATLKPGVVSANCSLTDPIGPARLTGTFMATRNPERADELLAEVKNATGNARAEQAAAR